jgi:uncharacterized protein YecE (DUF72 family)
MPTTPIPFASHPVSAAPLLCGVSGWEHRAWDHILYPAHPDRNFHPLRFLSARMDLLEADSTFLETPRPETTGLWAAHVAANPAFRFTVRLHRDFSHERDLAEPKVDSFHEAMAPLTQARRLGAVVMQMPASFRFTAENRDYLIRLRRTFHQYPLIAELRHRSWSADEALGTLVDYHIGLANLDQPEAAFAMEKASRLTSPIGYVKLHGRFPVPGHYDFDDRGAAAPVAYSYGVAELEGWQKRIEYLQRFAERVCVVFANSTAACSVTNSLQLASFLEAGRPGHRLPSRPTAAQTEPRRFRAA